MSLTEQYKKALLQPDMAHDAVQQQAVIKLEKLSLILSTTRHRSFFYFIKRLSPFKQFRPKPIQGLYFWGGVGRGKTWLMNLFYEELNIDEKCRIHFHHFMLDIHEKMASLSKQQHKQKNPLQQIAKDLAKKYKLLCIDEFIVTNITDAMILSELLHALFEYDICLVATSNRVPDDLYLNGLQRERFLPAINLIKKHTDVFNLDGGVDHRAALLEQSDVYYHPLTDDTFQQLAQKMDELAITNVVKNKALTILKREIQTLRCSDEIAWFDFKSICSTPRAAQDYIELAQRFSTVFISDIPVMDAFSDDKARRFIYLIDELYDRNVKLIVSASQPPDNLYKGEMLAFAFHRTSSRLIEMRSHKYLRQPHNPFI
ncbi:MAG: AFG1 family ATPase [Gammaproteobacteria bacterium]|nr:AFG1 family ATPase [Gammaproteobacteria bacterium]